VTPEAVCHSGMPFYQVELHVQGLTYVNSRATQEFEAPPRSSASHLASDPGSRPSAAQSWPELSMATRPGQRMEAVRGNGYAPVRGTPVMMMMMELHAKTGHKQDSQKGLAPSHCSSLC